MDRVDVRGDGVEASLLWGEPARLKAALREDDLRAHLARPVVERLLAAAALVLPAERGAGRR